MRIGGHYLKPLKSHGQPHVMLCVGYTTRRIASPGDGKRQVRFTLGGAAVSKLEYILDRWIEVDKVGITEAGQFWYAMQYLCVPGRTNWVWCNDLHKLLSTTGFYDLLGRNVYCIRPGAGDSPGDSGSDSSVRQGGYLICDSKTCVCLCTHTESGTQLLLTDVRNFGVELPSEKGGARQQCGQIVAFTTGFSNMVRSSRMGPLRPTAAGQSMAAYRAAHISSPMLCHDIEAVQRLERDAYHPGRCECFRLGQVYGPIYHVDVSGAYPRLTADEMMPTRLVWHGEMSTQRLRDSMDEGFLAVARVKIASLKPTLPVRYRGETTYPIGVYVTELAGPELQYAVLTDAVKEVRYAALYEASPCLRSWSKLMLGLRQWAKDGNRDDICSAVKAITNRLYGSFARRSKQWVPCKCSPPCAAYSMWFQEAMPHGHCCEDYAAATSGTEPWEERERGPTTAWRSVAWQVEYMTAPREHQDNITAISAWTNSLCRMKMLELISTAGREHCIYCDTDGLFVDQEGWRLLTASGLIGASGPVPIRLVASYASMFIRGPKHYDVGKIRVYSGTPKCAVFNDDMQLRWDQCESMYGALKSNRCPDGRLVGRHRELPRRFDRGIVRPDGRVDPLFIVEGD